MMDGRIVLNKITGWQDSQDYIRLRLERIFFRERDSDWYNLIIHQSF